MRGAIAFALRDRALELGGFEAVALELGLPVVTVRRWAKNGPPLTWRPEFLERFAQELWQRQQAATEQRDPVTGEWVSRRSPSERAALERLRNRPRYADAARSAAVQRLRIELRRLERRRPCEKKTWSPRVALARQLGVTSIRLARWLASGRVPESYMPEYDVWAQTAQAQEETRQREQGEAQHLIELARKPGWSHSLRGVPARPARRTPDVRTGEGLFESQQNSGYEWRLRAEAWCTFERIEEWCDWAGSRRRPALKQARPAPYWIITALVTVLHGRNRRRLKSPGGFRQFGAGSKRSLSNRLEIGGVVSTATLKRGGLPRAVRLFRAEMTAEFCEFETMWVHGILVRNWRRRGDLEQEAYRGRANARALAAHKQREQADARRKAKARRLARERAQKRTTGRHRSGAASNRARPSPRRPKGK